MIVGGNLSKKEYIATLAKKLSKLANEPISDKFQKKAETMASEGLFEAYQKRSKKSK